MDVQGRTSSLHEPITWHVMLAPAALLVVAGALWKGPWGFANPCPPPTELPARDTDTATVRQPNLRPEAHIGRRTYQCSMCHGRYRFMPESRPLREIHRRIVLRHGMNNRCDNCHNAANMDTLIDDWGNEVPYDQPQLLCRKCHGEVYRDWQDGAHGRTNGYWDTAEGPRVRHVCDECHDPHQPPFQPLAPAPPPHTLRMGEPAELVGHGEVRDPLRVYREPQPPASAPTTAELDESDLEELEEEP